MSRDFKVKFGSEEYPAAYLNRPMDARRAVASLCSDCLLGIDTETMALPEWHQIKEAALSPHLSTIRLIQLFDGKRAIVLDMLYLKKAIDDQLKELLQSRRFIAHNAVFDLAFLKKRFRVRSIDCGCTYIAFKLLSHASHPTDEGLRASLDAVTEGLCGIKVLKQNQRSDWSIPSLIFEQLEYAALDPICVLKIAEKMAPALEAKKLYPFYNLLKQAQHPVVEMHLNGIRFDEEEHRELTSRWREGLYAAKRVLLSQTRLDDVTGPKVSAWLEKNLSAELLQLWPRTDTGKLKTDAITFSDFGAVNDSVRPFGAYQKFKILTTDFGYRLLDQINESTRRLHPQYHLCGTRTGRLSCSSPNLQQAPRDKEFRAQFKPSEGMVFVGADYSMIELRVAAEVSRDPVMLKAFRAGEDLHTLMGSQIAGVDITTLPDKERKRARQIAKNVNFGCIYGIGPKKFASYARKASDESDVTEESAGELIKIFRKTYAGYRAWHIRLYERCMGALNVRTVCGKLRRLTVELCYGAAPNTIVQGSAAGCMLWSMVLLYDEISSGRLPARLVASIHDELILECKPEDAALVQEELVRCMVMGFKKVFPGGITKNLVEAKSGNSWMELK